MVIAERLIAEYRTLKASLPEDLLLLMQVGAFMQVLDDDARAVAAVTGLRLQMGGSVDAPVVAGGLPVAGLNATVGKLARAGRSVALAFQDEAKRRAVREVVRVVPPAERSHGA
ncbi:MAG: hypothetical protein U1F59_10765 [Candidatus Competibacteraceae bacterium]